MSKGPGRVQRAIRELLDMRPDLAFVTDELAEHCFPGVKHIERKHQISVLRAAFKIVGPDPDWIAERINGQGGGWVFYNRADVQSHAIGREIATGYIIYRSEKRALRQPGEWKRAGLGMRKKIPDEWRYNAKTRTDLLQQLPHIHLDGKLLVAEHIAYRDGDAATRAAMREATIQRGQKLARALYDGKCFQAPEVTGNETLNPDMPKTGVLRGLAETLRVLATQNDPDAVRAGLAAAAATLEALEPSD